MNDQKNTPNSAPAAPGDVTFDYDIFSRRQGRAAGRYADSCPKADGRRPARRESRRPGPDGLSPVAPRVTQPILHPHLIDAMDSADAANHARPGRVHSGDADNRRDLRGHRVRQQVLVMVRQSWFAKLLGARAAQGRGAARRLSAPIRDQAVGRSHDSEVAPDAAAADQRTFSDTAADELLANLAERLAKDAPKALTVHRNK